MSPAVRADVNRALLCIILLSGLCTCLDQYQLVDEPMTWSEAQQHCRKHFIDLATVDNMEDVAQLIAAAGGGYSGKAWIGLYDKSLYLYRVMGDDGYYGMNHYFVPTFAPGEPNNPRHDPKLCVAVKEGYIYDQFCSDQMPFVCYDNSNTSSPPRYVYITQKLTWDEAQSYCRQFHTDLTLVRTEEERTKILQAMPNNGFAFIGMFSYTWREWSDGTKRTFKNWLTGHPLGGTGNCATSLMGGANAGKWVEGHCRRKLPFICRYEKKQRFQIKLTALKSTIDLNDPAVMEAILNLMEAKMKEKGIPAGFRLTWIKKSDNTIFQEEEKDAD